MKRVENTSEISVSKLVIAGADHGFEKGQNICDINCLHEFTTLNPYFGMVAEMELSFIRDRQRAGIEAAKAKGVYKGRPVTFDHQRILALRKAHRGH